MQQHIGSKVVSDGDRATRAGATFCAVAGHVRCFPARTTGQKGRQSGVAAVKKRTDTDRSREKCFLGRRDVAADDALCLFNLR